MQSERIADYSAYSNKPFGSHKFFWIQNLSPFAGGGCNEYFGTISRLRTLEKF